MSSTHYRHEMDPVWFEIPLPFSIGQLEAIPIRFYSLAYLLGLLYAWWLLRRMSRKQEIALSGEQVDELVMPYGLLGILLGGRLGYVLFYDFQSCLENPLRILQIWKGGMASHGGILGLVVAFWLFSRKHKIPILHLCDLAALTGTVGLFLGRVANFINGELWGRVSDVPWAVIFPEAGEEPRHPSQLYEAFGEGLLLFTILMLARRQLLPRTGAMSTVFLIGYSLARIVCEQFRMPDEHIGYQVFGTTRGQLLTLAMVACGLYLGRRVLQGRTPKWEPTRPPAPAS